MAPVVRPVYYAPTIREIAADKTGRLRQQILDINDWNKLLMWETPTKKHLFEYIDAGETEGTYIAMDYDSCVNDTCAVESANQNKSMPSEARYVESFYSLNYRF